VRNVEQVREGLDKKKAAIKKSRVNRNYRITE